MTISTMVCKGCGQPLRGHYIQALGAHWHPEHFTCAACGRPMGNEKFTPHENRPYHLACYEHTVAPRCAHCHQPLSGRYVMDQQNRQYHEQCYTAILPRCAYCHKPLDGRYITDKQNQQYHEQCYTAVAPRCAYCNKPLVGEYLVDQWGTMFCAEHKEHYPKCAFCGRLVPPREQEARAETIRCATCRSTAIESTQQAAPMFRTLIQWVAGQGLDYRGLALTPELCRREKLAHYLQERSSVHSYGVTMSVTYTANGQVTHSEVKGVAILAGLPSLLFRGVAIHELGHVWLVMEGIRNLPSWAEEGFCELLSHRFYSEVNTAESLAHTKNIAQNSDPIYGEGFRRVRAIAERVGWLRFIETLQRSKRLPN